MPAPAPAPVPAPALVLASASPRRRELIARLGLEPARIAASDIDETPLKAEVPRVYAARMAREKALASADSAAHVLAGDTVVALGRRILPKPELLEEASSCLRLLSGRTHKVYSGLCVITPKDAVKTRLVETRVRFKRLSDGEIESYLASGEWRNKAGGYAIQGLAGSFVVKMIGSYTNVVGLPLYESLAMLSGEGFPVRFGWVSRA